MAIELATAYVSLVASARGIAGSIADELGKPLERAAKVAGQRVAAVLGREIADDARRAGAEAGDSITDALRRTVAAFDAPAIDLGTIDPPLIGKPVIPEPDAPRLDGIGAPLIGTPEIPEPRPLDLKAIDAPLIGKPEVPEPDRLKLRDIPAPDIGQPEIPQPDRLRLGAIDAPAIEKPDTGNLEAAVIAAARRAAKKASGELALIPNVNARDFEATVAAAANAAAAKARAQLANIPAGIDVDSLERTVAAAAAKIRSGLGGITAPDIAAPKIGQPEIPDPAPLDLADINAPRIGEPEIPEPKILKIPSLEAPKVGQPEIPEADDSKFLSGAKKAGIAAGAAAGAGLAVGFVSNLGTELSNDRLAAQLGINDPAFAKDLGKVAGKVYEQAFGDSIGEVNAGIRAVFLNGLLPVGATNKQIEAITEKVLGLADVFEQDLGGAAKATGQLIKTGMAKDADEALDLIVRGFQQGLDRSGDFLDTVTEYGTQFRKLGIDGPKALGLISQGLRGGARDADVVADALKEFSIRAVDGSEATVDGFRSIGLSAEKMASQIGEGGSAASGALDLVLDRLRSIPDPVERARVAVELFGTQSEDLGDALFSLDPSKAVAAIGDVGGAADRMNAQIDNSATTIEMFKRRTEVALSGLVGAFAPVIGGVLDLAPALGGLALAAPGIKSVALGLVGMVKGALGIGKTAAAVGELSTATKGLAASSAALEATSVGGGAVLAAAKIGGAAAAIGGAAVLISRAADDAVPALEKIDRGVIGFEEKIPVIGGLLGKLDRAVLGLGKSSKEAAEDTGDVSAAISTLVGVSDDLAGSSDDLGSAAGSLSDEITDEGSAFDATAQSLGKFGDVMNAILGVHVSAERAAIAYADSHLRLAESVQSGGRTLDIATEAGRANRSAILNIIDATAAHIGAMREEGATTDQLRATFEVHRGELARVLSQLGLNKDEANRYLGLLDAVPDSVLTNVTVKDEVATAKVGAFIKLLDDKLGTERIVTLRINPITGKIDSSTGPAFREHGGPVQAGQPYIVGERRAELFVPRTDGYIVPSVPAGGGGTSLVVNAPIYGVSNGAEAALRLPEAMRAALYLAGAA